MKLVYTFSKHGLILRAMLISIGLTCPSSICSNILARPDMASMVMRSSGSSLSSIPASMALRIVVENLETLHCVYVCVCVCCVCCVLCVCVRACACVCVCVCVCMCVCVHMHACACVNIHVCTISAYNFCTPIANVHLCLLRTEAYQTHLAPSNVSHVP